MKFILSTIATSFNNMKFKTKLVITYIILITVPLGIMWYKYSTSGIESIYELARQNVYEIVKQNNEIIDAKLDKIQGNSLNMVTDKVLFNEFKNVNVKNFYNLIEMDHTLSTVLYKYLSEWDCIYSSQLVTTYYAFGDHASYYVPYENFCKTDIYKKAVESNGGLQWIPTYNYSKMFNVDYLNDANLDYKYLFSAVRLLNCSYIEDGELMALDSSIERPVLMVNFKEDLYRDVFEKSITMKGSYYFVIDRNGNIISHSDKKKIATRENPEWLKLLVDKGSGTDFINIDGKKMIACYDTSNVTGWISVIALSQDELAGAFVPEMKKYTLELALMLIIISIIFAYLISESLTKPLNKLLTAIKKTGEGNFDTRIEGNDKGEVGYLIKKFNNMNDKIKLLIEENYKSKIREKEAEIAVLNIQLNPHFLYNTLNIINWMAIEKDEKEISKMLVSLSSMLQYTSHNHSETAVFENDLEWLKNYIYVMNYRFEGKFSAYYNIDPELLKYKVPKLFLQPFVENSIIHGFENMESGGIINITGWIEGDKRYFCIEDNGIGISEDKIPGVMKNEKQSIGIKNVNRRIKLTYGDEYGVEIGSKLKYGTRVKIVLPLDD